MHLQFAHCPKNTPRVRLILGGAAAPRTANLRSSPAHGAIGRRRRAVGSVKPFTEPGPLLWIRFLSVDAGCELLAVRNPRIKSLFGNQKVGTSSGGGERKAQAVLETALTRKRHVTAGVSDENDRPQEYSIGNNEDVIGVARYDTGSESWQCGTVLSNVASYA